MSDGEHRSRSALSPDVYEWFKSYTTPSKLLLKDLYREAVEQFLANRSEQRKRKESVRYYVYPAETTAIQVLLPKGLYEEAITAAETDCVPISKLIHNALNNYHQGITSKPKRRRKS